MFKANFKDIGDHIEPNNSDCLFLNWPFCYIGYDDVLKVLPLLHKALKFNGFMIMKEPILENNETVPRLCSTGQQLLTRPMNQLLYEVQKYFCVIKKQVIR